MFKDKAAGLRAGSFVRSESTAPRRKVGAGALQENHL